ncbi:MAG: HAD family hydrolase [Bacteriovoracia bacterium]
MKKRLVLFDIDGTLLWGGPVWKEAFLRSFSEYFPDIEFPKMSFGGKTDLQISREILSNAGLSGDQIEEKMHQIVERYIELAEQKIEGREHEVSLLPGVRPLLDELYRREDLVLGLLTGNVKKGAFAKLSCVELEHYFQIGIFGDDHWDRYELPALIIEKAKQDLGLHFSGKQVVIIGDTIHDVNCGKSVGARSIAVGTGRNNPMEVLLAQNPDYYFADLSATFEVVQAILEEL